MILTQRHPIGVLQLLLSTSRLFKVRLNTEHDFDFSASSASLSLFMKQPRTIHPDPPLMWVVPPCSSYSYDVTTFWLGIELQFLLFVPQVTWKATTWSSLSSGSHLESQLGTAIAALFGLAYFPVGYSLLWICPVPLTGFRGR